jgi:hypothetical protein
MPKFLKPRGFVGTFPEAFDALRPLPAKPEALENGPARSDDVIIP